MWQIASEVPLLLLMVVKVTTSPIGFAQVEDPDTGTDPSSINEQDHQNNVIIDTVLYVRDDVNDTTKYLLIDDMIIAKDPSRAGLLNAAWPNAIIPYNWALTITPQQRTMVTQAMVEITTRTCIQFRPAKTDDQYWLLFQNDPMNQGCSSFVGWQNRKNQQVQLSSQCSKGNAIHEIIHAIGFFHEQTRNDRDEYVLVHSENVQPGSMSNFLKESEMNPPSETETFGIPYNYDSIMHYGPVFFSKNGKPTIESLNNAAGKGNSANIGQREYISPGDWEGINKKYNCPTITDVEEGLKTSTTSKPGGNPMCNIPFAMMC